MSKIEITEKTNCRVCNGSLENIADFGSLCPSNFVSTNQLVSKYPLILSECSQCHLVQLRHTLDVDMSYRQYWYKSSLNSSMVDHLIKLLADSVIMAQVQPGDVVVDIGCNDGTMLGTLPPGVISVGFDPALNLSDMARKNCDMFVNDYFSSRTYPAKKKAKLITSIAMFYDVDNPQAFIKEILDVLDENGIWVIQMMDLKSMIETSAFDNVCFEHIMYYSLRDMEKLLTASGMVVYDVSYNKINGGSIRIITGRPGLPIPVNASVEIHKKNEDEFFRDNPVKEFGEEIIIKCRAIRNLVLETSSRGQVFVLGASTKGNTLLQMCGLDNSVILKACDVNSDKHGLRTVGTHIPIVSEEEGFADNPSAFLILPWHFTDFLKNKHQSYLDNGGKFIIPLPTPRVITSRGVL